MIISLKICALVMCYSIFVKQSDSSPPRNHFNNSHEGSVQQELSESETIALENHEEGSIRFIPITSRPECASNTTFCEEIVTYPYDYLRYSLSGDINKDLFVVDESPVENRISEPGEYYLCDSFDRIIFPKVGKTKYNKWKYIINQGENGKYSQGIRVEICRRLNKPCHLLGQFPSGYITTCKQKYTYRRLFSFSDNGEQVQDIFEMPSACCCSYKMDPNILIDFGKKFTPIG